MGILPTFALRLVSSPGYRAGDLASSSVGQTVPQQADHTLGGVVSKSQTGKKDRVDPPWPAAEGEHPVSELAADRQGALSPFGDVTFPLEAVPYVHPETEINR